MRSDPAFCPSTPLSSPTGEGHLLINLNPLVAPLPDPSVGPCHFSLGFLGLLPSVTGLSAFSFALPSPPAAIVSPHSSLRNYLCKM